MLIVSGNRTMKFNKVVCTFRIDVLHHFRSLSSNIYVQGTSYMGLQNLIKYFNSRCFDPDIGVPK